MKYNDEIMERIKMKAFFFRPPETLYDRIIICVYENKPAIVIEFYNKKREAFAYRIAPADNFSADELVEIFKILTFGGGEIRDEWYDIFSKWTKQLPYQE